MVAIRVLVSCRASVAASLGEFLKLQTILVRVGEEETNAAETAAFRRNVATRFQQLFKIDVNALTLTEQGLVKSNGAATEATYTTPSSIRPTTNSAPATTGTGAAAEAQWFSARSDTHGGISFEPMVLLARRRYCDVGEGPLESLSPLDAQPPGACGAKPVVPSYLPIRKVDPTRTRSVRAISFWPTRREACH